MKNLLIDRMKSNFGRRFLSSAADSAITWKFSGNTALLSLNRPNILNPLTTDICRNVKAKMIKWRKSMGVSCLIVKGSGKAFCAGGDIKALWYSLDSMDPAKRGTGMPGTADGDFFREEYEMNYLLGISKMPQVSIWDGIVMGGGVGLSIYGDYRVATERTLFAMPECSIGIFPDVGSSSWIPRMKVPGMGLYVALTGTRLGASDLIQTGLATHYVTSDRLADLEKELIEKCPPVSQGSEPYSDIKQTIGDILDKYHKTNLTQPDESRSIIKQHADLIETVFVKKSSIEEIIQTLDAERTSSTDAEKGKWIDKTLLVLLKSPPVSLKLTLTLLALAERHMKLDLKRCLEAEFKVMMHCLKGPNFKEGIRAAIIDKDYKPVWVPSTLHQVSLDDIKSYFSSLGDHELDLDQYDDDDR